MSERPVFHFNPPDWRGQAVSFGEQWTLSTRGSQLKMSLFVAVAWLLWLAPEAQVLPRTLYANNTVACRDAAGAGAEADKEFCSLRYASTIVRAGDTVLVGSARDGSGPVEFTRGGTSTARVVYRSTHPGGTTIGVFTDVRDEDFQATETPGVFALAAAPVGFVWQTYYPGILVDDPDNASIYTMVDTDGPLQLAAADEATVARVEGTYRYANGTLFVHPYGNRIPSVNTTDFVIGRGRALNFTTSTHYTEFDSFNISYSGSAYTFQVNGTGHVFRNIKHQGVALTWKGSSHQAHNISITHVHQRDASGGWAWHYKGTGTAAKIAGANHRLTDTHIFHNWNSDISTETATGAIIDGARIHGSPNHCGAGGTGNTIVRNVVLFQAQDYLWLVDTAGMVLEHVVAAGDGIGLEAINRPLGPITVRNSILRGKFSFIRGLQSRCTWEAGSLLENSIVHESAAVERCADNRWYPLRTTSPTARAGYSRVA